MSDIVVPEPAKPTLSRLVVDAYMEVLSFAKTLELACAQQLECIGRGSALLTDADRDALLHKIHGELTCYLAEHAQRAFPLSHTHRILHETFPNSVPSVHQVLKVVAKDQHDIIPANADALRQLERNAKQRRAGPGGPRLVLP